MSKKKGKFDLTRLVHDGFVKDGETFFFVSNPSMNCKVVKQPTGESTVSTADGITTVHAVAVKCLGTEPPEHASRWFRNEKGHTFYEIWQSSEEQDQYAA